MSTDSRRFNKETGRFPRARRRTVRRGWTLPADLAKDLGFHRGQERWCSLANTCVMQKFRAPDGRITEFVNTAVADAGGRANKMADNVEAQINTRPDCGEEGFAAVRVPVATSRSARERGPSQESNFVPASNTRERWRGGAQWCWSLARDDSFIYVSSSPEWDDLISLSNSRAARYDHVGVGTRLAVKNGMEHCIHNLFVSACLRRRRDGWGCAAICIDHACAARRCGHSSLSLPDHCSYRPCGDGCSTRPRHRVSEPASARAILP